MPQMYREHGIKNILCIPGVWHISVVSQPVTDQHIEGMFLIAQVSHLLIMLIKNHA